MHLRAVFAVSLLGTVAGCFPPTQTQYNPSFAERPQPVQFFQGTLIDVRPATFDYGTIGGIGATFVPSYPNFAGLAVGGNGSAAGIGAALPGVAVLAGGVVPELPATEYTVCLDRGTNPPDPYVAPGAPAAVIVVQNNYPDRYPNDGTMAPPEPVWVRVVGNAGRVMRRNAVTAPAPLVLHQAPADASCLSAGGPMPVPLQGVPAVASLPSVQSYGYRQALGQALYQHWTIEP